MSDDNTKAAAKLSQLGDRARVGWAKLHPVSEQHLAAVRAAVRQQWEQEHTGKLRSPTQQSAERSHPTQQKSAPPARPTKPKRQSKSKDHGHSH